MKHRQYYTDNHSDPEFFSGIGTEIFKEAIKEIIYCTDSKTLLDYGSGKGYQYTNLKFHEYWEVDVDMYDFGVEGIDVLPDKSYDGVIALRLLDLVPEDELDEVLTNIFARAKKFVFIALHNLPPRKYFPDGKHIGVTLEPLQWWEEKIKPYNTKGVDLEITTVLKHIKEWNLEIPTEL